MRVGSHFLVDRVVLNAVSWSMDFFSSWDGRYSIGKCIQSRDWYWANYPLTSLYQSNIFRISFTSECDL